MTERKWRVGLTGAGGMLGREVIAEAARRGWELSAWDRAAFDITNREQAHRAVAGAGVDFVVHGAAWTDVDGCEGDPELAMRVNGRGTENLAGACEAAGSRLIMVSTDYVFPGDQPDPYVESDATGPLSSYGRSKLAGEEAVRALGDRGAVARTAWVYADHGGNFFRTMLRLAESHDTISVVDDQKGSPTFAADLAVGLLDLGASEATGTFHVTNRGSVTWHGFARAIFEATGREMMVNAMTSEEFPRPAPRPANSVLENTRFAECGVPEMPTWEDGLRRCAERIAESS